MRIFVLSAGLLVMTSCASYANIPDYCAAYARDYADMGEKSTDWQRRHDDAQASCITRFSAFAATPVKAKPKPKVVAVAKPIEAKLEPKKQTPPETKIVAKSTPKLETGSSEWIAYCKQKYVSFDESKGTYLSKTGVERKCLITAD
jgi:hypothetical protein